MDACFLSSNSFSKTMDLLSPLRGRISTFNKCKNHQSSKFAPKVSVTCCLSGPAPASPQDEEGPLLTSDWRSFRARLVAQQRASPLQDLSAAAYSDGATGPIKIGDKWAHTIHEPEKGCLLIATEKLDGVHIFERTVILLLSTGPVGPTGIILNRPSLMSIKEMRSSALDVSGPFSDRPLFFGGPLEEGLFLVSPSPQRGSDGVGKSGVLDEVMKGVYYGTKESVGCAAEMVKRSVVEAEEFRFFDGYCAWEREQLRGEIRAGYWTVAACSPSVIEQTSVGSVGLWEEFRFFDGYCAWEREQLRGEIRAGYWTVAACSPSVIEQTSVGSVGLWEEILGLMGPRKVW